MKVSRFIILITPTTCMHSTRTVYYKLTCSTGSGKTLSASGTSAGCTTTSGNLGAVTVSPDDKVAVAMGTVVKAFLEVAAALSTVLSTGTHSPQAPSVSPSWRVHYSESIYTLLFIIILTFDTAFQLFWNWGCILTFFRCWDPEDTGNSLAMPASLRTAGRTIVFWRVKEGKSVFVCLK